MPVTLEIIINLIAAAIMLSCWIFLIGLYRQKKYTFFLVLANQYLTAVLVILLVSISLVILNPVLYLIGLNLFIPMGIANFRLIDFLSRESNDPKKIALITMTSVTLLLASLFEFLVGHLNQPAILPPYNYETLKPTDWLKMTVVFHVGVNGVVFLYSFLRINRLAPKELKKGTHLSMLGASLWGLVPIIFYATRLYFLVPGIHFLSWSIGTVILTYSFTRNPQLAYINPLKNMRLMVVDNESGLALYSHSWEGEEEVGDSDAFSAMILAFSGVLDQYMKGGYVREIKLDESILITQKCRDTDVSCVLVSNKSSKSLRSALKSFSDRFHDTYSSFFSDVNDVTRFESASDLIEECFPFLPEL
ncbi:MAG: hypothetical protein ACFFCS_06690 [Candidatus Hodarchaeota archaeon]